jgi:triosephosphate isomerase (TIM)
MARTKFVAGNWKMNTDKSSAIAIARAVMLGSIPPEVVLGVAPPFVYLEAVGNVVNGSPRVLLGGQDCCSKPNGAYTGEISIAMLKDLGVQFCLAGHSERRHTFHESSSCVSEKAAAIYAGGLTLIHCVGETLAERDKGITTEVVQKQLNELTTDIQDPSRLVIAYEPVWAIGTGRNATDAQAQEVHAFIRQSISETWGKDFADQVRIQYGGSMKPENAKGLLDQRDVDGGLIGGASLKADSFLAIAKAAV